MQQNAELISMKIEDEFAGVGIRDNRADMVYIFKISYQSKLLYLRVLKTTKHTPGICFCFFPQQTKTNTPKRVELFSFFKLVVNSSVKISKNEKSLPIFWIFFFEGEWGKNKIHHT